MSFVRAVYTTYMVVSRASGLLQQHACYANPWCGHCLTEEGGADKLLTHTYARMHGVRCVAMAAGTWRWDTPVQYAGYDWPGVVDSFSYSWPFYFFIADTRNRVSHHG